KCKKPDDVLFINASEHFEKARRQNQLLPEHIDKIVDTYQHRREEERYARRDSMEEIEKNDYNLNITRYVSTDLPEPEINLAVVHENMKDIKKRTHEPSDKHNQYLKAVNLPPI